MEARASQGTRLRRSTWRTLKKGSYNQQMGLVVALLVFSLAIWLKNHNYGDEANIVNILVSSVYIFIIGIVSTMVFVCGGLDLSVGSVYALGCISSAMALTNGVPIVLSILIGLGAGALAGLLNGIVIEYLGIPPLITTLGSLYVIEGVVVVLTGGNSVFPLPAAFNAIGEDTIGPVPWLPESGNRISCTQGRYDQ